MRVARARGTEDGKQGGTGDGPRISQYISLDRFEAHYSPFHRRRAGPRHRAGGANHKDGYEEEDGGVNHYQAAAYGDGESPDRIHRDGQGHGEEGRGDVNPHIEVKQEEQDEEERDEEGEQEEEGEEGGGQGIIEEEEEHPEPSWYSFPCRCSGQFVVTLRDLEDGVEVVGCTACGEWVGVGYEVVEGDEVGEGLLRGDD